MLNLASSVHSTAQFQNVCCIACKPARRLPVQVPASAGWQTLFWNMLRPFRSEKTSCPSLPLMSASSNASLPVSAHVTDACHGTPSCSQNVAGVRAGVRQSCSGYRNKRKHSEDSPLIFHCTRLCDGICWQLFVGGLPRKLPAQEAGTKTLQLHVMYDSYVSRIIRQHATPKQTQPQQCRRTFEGWEKKSLLRRSLIERRKSEM